MSLRSVRAGLLGVAVTGMTVVIFEAVAGRPAALISGGCALLVFAAFWLVPPLNLRDREQQPPGS